MCNYGDLKNEIFSYRLIVGIQDKHVGEAAVRGLPYTGKGTDLPPSQKNQCFRSELTAQQSKEHLVEDVTQQTSKQWETT